MATLRRYDVNAPLELLADPVDQWLDWEEQANLVGFRTSTEPVTVEVVTVPRDDTEVYVLSGADRELVERFVGPETVRFPRHPLNRDASVAWFDAPVTDRWTARFTASRTLAMPGPETGRALFSLKLATDHPHPDFHQPEKTKLREEGLGAVQWATTLDRIDSLMPALEAALLVREVLVVLQRGGEAGFMVRDLRRFQDGHLYLPALSLPFVGRQIAARHDTDFERFWRDGFATPVGRAKAEIFTRYGLWYETPNPQNVVIQLAPSLRPTGRIVFRDLGDGECGTDSFTSEGVPWTKLRADIRPETETSFWAFGEAAEHSVSAATLADWYRAHDAAYYGELARWQPGLAPDAGLAPTARLAHWNEVLRSDRGVALLGETRAART